MVLPQPPAPATPNIFALVPPSVAAANHGNPIPIIIPLFAQLPPPVAVPLPLLPNWEIFRNQIVDGGSAPPPIPPPMPSPILPGIFGGVVLPFPEDEDFSDNQSTKASDSGEKDEL